MTREVIKLTDGWRFKLDDDLAGAQEPGFADDDWSVVSVPHSWNRAGYYIPETDSRINTAENVNMHRGVGWYRLTFAAPANLAEKLCWLQFDAASRIAEIWLNGVRLGEHKGGFSRFRFNATPALRTGGQPNVLVVKTDNTNPDVGTATADVLPLAGDFFVHGGLYRSVSLIVTDAVHIDMLDFGGPGVYAATTAVEGSQAQIAVRTKLCNDSAASVETLIVATLRSADGALVAQGSQAVMLAAGDGDEISQTLSVGDVRLWDGLADPYLYKLRVEVRAPSGIALDSTEQSFGVRQFRIDPDEGFFLNGRSTPLRGVSRHQDREGKGWALSEADEAQDVEMICELGANTIRLAHYQQSQHIHELADRYGLILWDEIPLVSKWTLTADQPLASPGLVDNARQQLIELIRQNYNHASVVVWGIANEVDFGRPVSGDFGIGAEGEGPDPAPLLEFLDQIVKDEDPGRPSTIANCCEGANFAGAAHVPIVAEKAEVSGANRYYGWYYGKPEELGPQLDLLYAAHPKTPLSISEYGAGGSFSQQTDNPLGGPASAFGRIQPEGYESYVHERCWADITARPYLWATWIWNMFDFATTIRREGDAMDINTKGLVRYDRSARKDAFFFYQANWAKAPVVHITGRRYVDRAYAVTDIKVYSNAAVTELFLNGASLGTMETGPHGICVWPGVRLAPGVNQIRASGAFADGKVSDQVEWRLDAAAHSQVRINCGALMGVTTTDGRYGSDNFFVGGATGKVGKKALELADTPAAHQLLSTFRKGAFAYEAPIENGAYSVTLKFVEPGAIAAGERTFDVFANGHPALEAFDIVLAAGGVLKAVERSFPVEVSDGVLRLDFKPLQGEALVSVVEIRS